VVSWTMSAHGTAIPKEASLLR